MGTNENKTAGGGIPAPDITKTKKRPFELKERCQELSADIYTFTANAPKELRVSICKRAQDTSCEIVHSIRLANSFKIGNPGRIKAQLETAEFLDRLEDLLPIMTRCRCITLEQEAQTQKKLDSIKSKLKFWQERDSERLEQAKAKLSSGVTSVQENKPSSSNAI